MHRIVNQLFLISAFCVCLNAADSLPAVSAPTVVEEDTLPIFAEHDNTSAILDVELTAARRALRLAGCKVAPLPEIEDPEAQAFERNAESDPADVDGLMPDTAEALDTFKALLASVGGTLELKSAYRPPAYQAHLHDVWVKWVKELRGNRSAGCSALREDVGAEFKRHKLLVKQQPVPESDHSLGLAFDAAVAMPHAARLNRKRVTVDKLAALAGIRRPNSRRDPVHFKLLQNSLPTISIAPAVGFQVNLAN